MIHVSHKLFKMNSWKANFCLYVRLNLFMEFLMPVDSPEYIELSDRMINK